MRPGGARPIRGVLFDATGTLIALAEPVGETYARLARDHGVDVPAPRLEDGFRQIVATAPPRAFPGAEASAIADLERGWWRDVVRESFRAADPTRRFDDFDSFFEALYSHYARGAAWRLRAGACEALAALTDRGLALGALSNFDHRLPDILQSLGIDEFLRAVTLPGPHGLAKPEPALFEIALRALGTAASETVHVGDDPETDLAAAARVGLRVIDSSKFDTLADLPARLDHLGA